ncbi:MAG: hypothetical protein WC729_29205 [Sphingomonas sp.]|jgi:hypothetical protein|uniref:hypothetical protein n=1 Tax=Sphingomonas sp. TaxID=28214 RepID=UPI0035658E0A
MPKFEMNQKAFKARLYVDKVLVGTGVVQACGEHTVHLDYPTENDCIAFGYSPRKLASEVHATRMEALQALVTEYDKLVEEAHTALSAVTHQRSLVCNAFLAEEKKP